MTLAVRPQPQIRTACFRDPEIRSGCKVQEEVQRNVRFMNPRNLTVSYNDDYGIPRSRTGPSPRIADPRNPF